jgi:hypothetical protein
MKKLQDKIGALRNELDDAEEELSQLSYASISPAKRKAKHERLLKTDPAYRMMCKIEADMFIGSNASLGSSASPSLNSVSDQVGVKK